MMGLELLRRLMNVIIVCISTIKALWVRKTPR